MQVILIKDCLGPNPDFNPNKPVDYETNNPERVVPKGTILSDPMAFYHCRGDDPNAEPYDDEAKANQARYLAWRAKQIADREKAAGVPAGPDDEPETGDAEPSGGLTPVLPVKPADSGAAAADATGVEVNPPVVIQDAPQVVAA